MPSAFDVQAALFALANPTKAKTLSSFFKTGPGEYGAGDRFLGIVVPQQRRVAKAFEDLPLPELRTLLHSPYHEHRLTALLVLTYRYLASSAAERERIYRFYLQNAARVNNWDLVDSSAPNIVGAYLLVRPVRERRAVLDRLVASDSLWERRIAIVATLAFIRARELQETFRLAERLFADEEDLLHKATGWMLREAGKRDTAALEAFLEVHAPRMPRTMLRYAIERLPEKRRRYFLERERA